MLILVLNSWSSSLKYQLFDIKKNKILTKWNVERIWIAWSFLNYEINWKKFNLKKNFPTHTIAVQTVLDLLLKKHKILKSIKDLSAIGHRVVHGWEIFSKSVRINSQVIAQIRKCCELAPLHNPPNLAGILACQKLAPSVPQIAVFDTAFHQTMKPANYIYAIPYKYFSKYKIRRYGFHWTSHQYVYEKFLSSNSTFIIHNSKLKIITCHIGNGASITAISSGRVVETSMWMTPIEWLMMWTRSGSIDPGIIPYIMKKEKLNADQIEKILNNQSWLLWISWISNDMRDILAGIKKWNPRCKLALDMYINCIVKYIWAYVSLMNGLDVIILTGWMMEGNAMIRKILISRLAWLTSSCKVKIVVIPTNEELMIAQETAKIIS